MRILIAEDELLERKAMKKFITDNFNDMEVVGEAVNGRKAIELAASVHPDIIFMDIRMPGINGLKAIKNISLQLPKMKFILVSAYDSFDYAKEAMQYGIKDYILKPAKKEEIIKTLRRLQKEIEKENEATALLEERLLTKLMEDPLPATAQTLQVKLFPEMKSACFFVVKSAEPVARETVAEMIDQKYIIQQQTDSTVICIISREMIEKADALNMARKLQVRLHEATYIGVSHPVQPLEKMPQAYQKAYGASLQLATAKKGCIGFLQEQAEAKTKTTTEIAYFVEKGQGERACQYYRDNAGTLSENDKENIYMMVKQILMKKDITPADHAFTSLQTIQDWQDFLQLSCMKVKTFYQSKQYMNRAKGYIEKHFNDAITLEEVAIKVHLSPNYFSNLFKQELGMTFIDYLTNVRLQKAKELLEKNELSLKEISYMVGYKDPNYFSRVFKKHYNESPKHFQQAIFKK